MVKEILSVAKAQSKVGGSFFMDIRKTEWSVAAGGLQQARTKNISSNQKEKTWRDNFMFAAIIISTTVEAIPFCTETGKVRRGL